jgi:enoyl-CoA hydratase/carnithine racemase
LSAAEAKETGLVHKVVETPSLEKATREYCETLAANAPITLRTAKRMIRELLRSPGEFDAAQARAWVKECFDSADYVEGRKAFLEKRKPVFRGK